jgi:hypothetical protein
VLVSALSVVLGLGAPRAQADAPALQPVELFLAVCCSSACSDLGYDDLNCGTCGNACAQGAYCNGGACVQIASCAKQTNGQPCGTADGGFGMCCYDTCVDIMSDPHKCGYCDRACAAGARCEEQPALQFYSQCVAPDGGEGYDCTNLGCDPGWTCVPGAGLGPEAADCMRLGCISTREADCAYALGGDAGYVAGTCCAGTCTNGSCDPSARYPACGGTQGVCLDGGACLSWAPGDSSCFPIDCHGRSEKDECAITLDGGITGAFGMCCAGSCIDPGSDPNNCGGCGVPCDICVASGYLGGFGGICLPTGPTGDCNASCGFGSVCVFGFCVTSTCTDSNVWWNGSCLASDGKVGYCCPGDACADLRSDPLNCGRCGAACPASQFCDGGACRP